MTNYEAILGARFNNSTLLPFHRSIAPSSPTPFTDFDHHSSFVISWRRSFEFVIQLPHGDGALSLFSDYHMHSQGHRVQPFSEKLLQPWVDAAKQRGLRDIAFTDHDRYHAGV